MYATRLFLKPAMRELFLTIKRDDIQFKWLQDQMDKDMQRRSSSMTSVHLPRGNSQHADRESLVNFVRDIGCCYDTSSFLL